MLHLLHSQTMDKQPQDYQLCKIRLDMFHLTSMIQMATNSHCMLNHMVRHLHTTVRHQHTMAKFQLTTMVLQVTNNPFHTIQT